MFENSYRPWIPPPTGPGTGHRSIHAQILERMRRLFAFALTAAQFVFALSRHWPPRAVYWLCQLDGKPGSASDRDGLYLAHRIISAVFKPAAPLRFMADHPFPWDNFPCVSSQRIGMTQRMRNSLIITVDWLLSTVDFDWGWDGERWIPLLKMKQHKGLDDERWWVCYQSPESVYQGNYFWAYW